MSQDILGPMNIKIITDENENHEFSSNQEKKLLFENSILFFDDQRPNLAGDQRLRSYWPHAPSCTMGGCFNACAPACDPRGCSPAGA